MTALDDAVGRVKLSFRMAYPHARDGLVCRNFAADLTLIVEGLEKAGEKADKLTWQVRDTCTRAETAEAERDALKAEVERLREGLDAILDVAERTNPDHSFNAEGRLGRCANRARTLLNNPKLAGGV